MTHNWETRDQWAEMSDCPFCGAEASEFSISVTYSENVDGVLNGFMGECSECAAMGPPANSEQTAICLWNRRPAQGIEARQGGDAKQGSTRSAKARPEGMRHE